MTLHLEPADTLRARLRVPGDKSISHRALLLNSLSRGQARIRGLAPGEDVAATIDALRSLGVAIDRAAPDTAFVTGGAAWRAPEPLDARNSGTTARLLLGALAPRADGRVWLRGDDSLCRRPMDRVIEPLRAMGAAIDELEEPGRLPLAIEGRTLEGRAHRLPVASAQVKGALLLAGLAAAGETSVAEPAPSRDHTERMLIAMGASIERTVGASGPLVLRPGEIAAADVQVPGDLSSAAPFLALAAARSGNEVEIEDLGLNPTRTGFLEVLRRMGARVESEIVAADPEPRGTLRVAGDSLHGVEIVPEEVAATIDELPLVAVLATQASGLTRVRGAAELRVKESDRIEGVVAGLRAMGARIEPTADGFEVEGPAPLYGAALDAAGDHRVAMALAVAACLARGASRLEGESWVGISYPGFFRDLAAASATGTRA